MSFLVNMVSDVVAFPTMGFSFERNKKFAVFMGYLKNNFVVTTKKLRDLKGLQVKISCSYLNVD